jgi:PAS domain S-box-containing protein
MEAIRIVKRAPGPAIATDAENRILELNRAAMKLLGYDAERARGRNLHRLMHVRDIFGNRLTAEPFAFCEMVSRSDPVRSFDIEVSKASGDSLRVGVSVIVVVGSEPEDYGLVYQLRPVYYRREADEAIERILAFRGDPDADPLKLRGSGSRCKDLNLTGRQVEILRLMAQGASVKEIAPRLNISVHTVRTHIQRTLRKLKVKSQLEAVAVAFRERLI